MLRVGVMADNRSEGSNGSSKNGLPKTAQYAGLYSALIQEKEALENRLEDIDQDLAFLIFAQLQKDWKMKAPSKKKKATRKKKAARKKK